MTNRYDLLTSRKDREGKTRYTKIGTMFPAREGEGFSLKLDALPLPNDKGEVWVSAFVPRPREDAPQPREQAGSFARNVDDPRTMQRQGSGASREDDIPFSAECR
jgi:hypothetical protein